MNAVLIRTGSQQTNPGFTPLFIAGHQIRHQQHETAGGILPPPDIDKKILFVDVCKRLPFIRFRIQDNEIAAIKTCGPQIAGKFLIVRVQNPLGDPAQPVEQDGVGFQGADA